MKKEIVLLTGPPGTGKTTVIRKVLGNLKIPAQGFFTQEIRVERRRVGFEIVTLEGNIKTMAHVDYRNRIPHRVGKYGVDLEAIDELATASILKGIEDNALIIIDEIGPMEILSNNFRSAVIKAIESPSPILGTIAKHHIPFIDQVKSLKKVRLIDVNYSNRDHIPGEMINLFQ